MFEIWLDNTDPINLQQQTLLCCLHRTLTIHSGLAATFPSPTPRTFLPTSQVWCLEPPTRWPTPPTHSTAARSSPPVSQTFCYNLRFCRFVWIVCRFFRIFFVDFLWIFCRFSWIFCRFLWIFCSFFCRCFCRFSWIFCWVFSNKTSKTSVTQGKC